MEALLESLNEYNVVYQESGKDHFDAMPTGNGDIGINVWTENEHDIIILIAKNDSWEESSILCKVGKLRLTIPSEVPLQKDENFVQTLHLEESKISIVTSEYRFDIWVDANEAVIHIDGESSLAKKIQVNLDWYRSEDAPLPWKENAGSIFKSLDGDAPYPSVVYKDTLLEKDNAIVWCHCNQSPKNDGYFINMELQGLKDYVPKMPHPLKGRTFGAWVQGEGLVSASEQSLVSKNESQQHNLCIAVVTKTQSSVEDWTETVASLIESTKTKNLQKAFENHKTWWRDFWNKSHIIMFGSDEKASHVSRVYMIQRYLNACSSRGAFPIKFNGGIWSSIPRGGSYDFRQWGDGYWWQNQRMVYWPMIASGDFDLMKCFFDCYDNALELNKFKTQKYYGHSGAHFAETIYWWGAAVSAHYGWTPFEERSAPEEECTYTRYYFQNNIERVLMMHEFWLYTQDNDFANQTLLPHAHETLLFYDQHYQRKNGKLKFFPAQSLETWHEAEDPTPEVAGLNYLLTRLLSLPVQLVGDEQKEKWQSLLQELPELPQREIEGESVIAPAHKYEVNKNVENPELYCVFPYRLYGLGKTTDIEIARNTMAHRVNKQQSCWCQNEIQQAYLGLTAEAKAGVVNRAYGKHEKASFPTYWGAFYDSAPCQDHAGGLLNSLQSMLIQSEGKEIRLFPAWPKEWDVNFKCYAPYNTIVEGSFVGGELLNLKVSPQSRMDDVVVCETVSGS